MTPEAKQNILVTGVSGFVGQRLIPKLAEHNNLFLVSRDENFSSTDGKVLHGDLSDPSFCSEIVKNIDTVYYLAGFKKNIAFHTKNSYDFVVGNVEPIISFLKAVNVSTIKKIIYLSSTNVGLYKEGEEDGYVVGKYINELILNSFAKQYGMDIKIVRSAGIYGPGDNFNKETANFIPAMINKVYECEKEISVWGTGKRELQFVYIDDLVSNLVTIADSTKNFFTIGNPETLTINEIVEKIISLSGKELEIKNDATKPDKPTQLFEFDNAEPPQWNFNLGLPLTLSYYKSIKK